MDIGTKAAGVATAGRVVAMVAKYSSVCKCGAFIEPGDTMSYDTLSRKSLCYDCIRRHNEFPSKQSKEPGNGSKENSECKESADENRCHAFIDRFRELRLLPRPLSDSTKSELKLLLIKFRNEFASSEPVRAFVSEIARCKHSGAEFCPIKTRYPGACIHCGGVSSVGELVLYDHHVKRVHCLVCDCMRGL